MSSGTPTTLEDLVASWMARSGSDLGLQSKLERLRMLARDLFIQYQPYENSSPSYLDRLSHWVGSAETDKGMRALFELAYRLVFVGIEELKCLYRSAYNGEITRWLIDASGIDPLDDSGEMTMGCLLSQTFFGSMGMDLGTFCHCNGISQDRRPDFREYADGDHDAAVFSKYLSENDYQFVVAVEDNVGTGNQMKTACKFLSKLDLPVLLCPMMAAHPGAEVGLQLELDERTTFSPVSIIPDNASLVHSENAESEIAEIRDCLERIHDDVSGESPGDIFDKYLTPLGFRDSGSLMLTFQNCPNNVPPAVWHKSDSWEPLFRRVDRES